MIYLILYLEFFKIGLFAIGGGLASLPFLRELVDKYGWITHEQLANMIAISESTPGAIGINVATYVGNEVAGPLGGLVATLGEVSPSIIVITVLARALQTYSTHPLVQGGFAAVRPAVAGLIGAVAYELAQNEFLYRALNGVDLLGRINVGAVGMFAVILVLLERFRWHPVVFLAAAAVIGIIFQM